MLRSTVHLLFAGDRVGVAVEHAAGDTLRLPAHETDTPVPAPALPSAQGGGPALPWRARGGC